MGSGARWRYPQYGITAALLDLSGFMTSPLGGICNPAQRSTCKYRRADG